MSRSQMEEDRLAAVAMEYRRKGYDVHLEPAEDVLPAFLRGFKADVIAKSPADNVIVQVTSPPRFDGEQAKRLAEVVELNPGWRYEVAFVSPPVAPDVPARDEVADDEKVTRMLKDAETLSRE